MPTYEYACKACDHRFEIVQSFSEDGLTTCPECEQEQLRKVFSAAGIIFKGDGWHIKDYAKASSSTTTSSSDKDGSNSSGKNGSSEGGSGKGSSASSDTASSTNAKPATAKGSKGSSQSAAVKPAAN